MGRRKDWILVFAGLALAASQAQAQGALEIRGGINVPTFDITDAAKAGPSVGVGLNYKLGERLWVIGDADFGFHSGADLAGGGSGPDVNVYHYIAKLGYEVVGGTGGPVTVVLNAGAGAMTFAVDGGDSFTYPAINVGAKLIYGVGSRLSLVVSPQGDIAFTDEDELGTSNAWVWPVAVGFRVNF
jgi:hypothetical protein